MKKPNYYPHLIRNGVHPLNYIIVEETVYSSKTRGYMRIRAEYEMQSQSKEWFEYDFFYKASTNSWGLPVSEITIAKGKPVRIN